MSDVHSKGRRQGEDKNPLVHNVLRSKRPVSKKYLELLAIESTQKNRKRPPRFRFFLQQCGCCWLLSGVLPEYAALDLVFFYAFEEGAEVAFAEAFVAFALDELKEDWADDGFGEDL